MFGCKMRSKNEKIHSVASKYLDTISDVVSISQKLGELEKIKSILFDETQLKLFNLMSKPTIHYFE
jgi:hypothetical protein